MIPKEVLNKSPNKEVIRSHKKLDMLHDVALSFPPEIS